jgi:hypothetical protein
VQPATSNQLEWDWQWQHLAMCKHHQLITQCRLNDVKIVKQGAGGHGSALTKYEISHFLQWPQKHLTQHHVKSSFHPPCSQWKNWIPIGSKGWLQMQCDTSRTKGWERPNLVRNAVEKTSKSKQKKGMTGWANNQTLAFDPTHNLKSVWCELKGK